MKKVLLVGGAGYVGSVVTSHFLRNNIKVNVLDNFMYNNQFAVLPYIGDPGYTFFHGRMDNTALLEKATEGVTDVILLAGLVGDPITKKYPTESELINEAAVRKCIDFMNGKGIHKVVFISTCSNYGLIGEHELADEDFQLSPLSLYAKAKVTNELYLLSQKDKVDYNAVVLRFATAFGLSPRMRFDLSLSEFVRDLCFGKELLVYDEDTWRPYCHVRDFARLLETVLNSEDEKVRFQVFNAGGDINNYTKKMIVQEILIYIPEGKIKYGTNGSDPRNYRVNFSKVRNTLGFTPAWTVADGIKELVGALGMGLYGDALNDPLKYGNYEINYKP